MRENSQSVFLVEGLQPSWLGTRAKRAGYGTLAALSLGLIFAPTVGLNFVLTCGLFSPMIGGSIGDGLIVGLIVGLNRGGSAAIKHYALRLTLWLNGKTPLNFVKFLDHCAKLILLKKVGGGYIFIHRMLLDYFADLTPQSTKAENGKAGSVGR